MFQRLRARLDRASVSTRAREVRDRNLTYLSFAKLRSLEAVLRRLRRNGATGDYLEFGVALGGSAILIASSCPPQAVFHGYDVFGMIPPPGPTDEVDAHRRYAEIRSGRSAGIGGDAYYGYVDDLYEQVCRRFDEFGLSVDGERIALHKGRFEETVDPQDTRPVAFAHIDCDWYDAVRYCLEAVHERLAPGGAIVLDDYNDYGGCRKAVDSYVAANGDIRFLRHVPHAVLQRL